MAHEIDFDENGKARMFSGEGIMPWHGLVTPVEGLLTAEAALKEAGLDWEVDLKQQFTQDDDGTFLPIKDRFATRRRTDKKILGDGLSKGYHVYQNLEAFQFLNKITDTNDAEAVFTSAGALFGGSRTFMVMKLTQGFTVGDNDAHDLYLMATNSHDGSQAFTVTVTPIRAVCNNTVTLGLAQAKAKWSIRHKIALKDQTQKAREILDIGYRYEEAFEQEVQRMIEIEVSKDQLHRVLDKVVPVAAHDVTVDEIMNIWENEATVNMGGGEGNAWGAFNAVTFFTDHKAYKTPESKFKSIIGTGTGQGFGEALRPKAHKALLALAK